MRAPDVLPCVGGGFQVPNTITWQVIFSCNCAYGTGRSYAEYDMRIQFAFAGISRRWVGLVAGLYGNWLHTAGAARYRKPVAMDREVRLLIRVAKARVVALLTGIADATRVGCCGQSQVAGSGLLVRFI